MDARNDMLRLLHSRRDGYSLEQPFYTDPDYFKLDMELIWYRDWLFIGHDCELPKPGSYITVQIGDYPVVLVRDQKGNINAFHNSCRHRGSRVCNTEKGTAAKLVCPYHQWTYELDGRLLFARQMAEGFDKSQFGLKPGLYACANDANRACAWRRYGACGDRAGDAGPQIGQPTLILQQRQWFSGERAEQHHHAVARRQASFGVRRETGRDLHREHVPTLDRRRFDVAIASGGREGEMSYRSELHTIVRQRDETVPNGLERIIKIERRLDLSA